MSKIKFLLFYLSVPFLFLGIARINHFLIETIFGLSLIWGLLSIFILSCILPVSFYLSKNFYILEKNLKDNDIDAEREALSSIVPYFSSFFTLFLIIKSVQFVNIDFLSAVRLKEAVISLNYASMIAVIIYTNRRELNEEQVNSIYELKEEILKVGKDLFP